MPTSAQPKHTKKKKLLKLSFCFHLLSAETQQTILCQPDVWLCWLSQSSMWKKTWGAHTAWGVRKKEALGLDHDGPGKTSAYKTEPQWGTQAKCSQHGCCSCTLLHGACWEMQLLVLEMEQEENVTTRTIGQMQKVTIFLLTGHLFLNIPPQVLNFACKGFFLFLFLI